MGQATKELKERNQELLKDFESGNFTMVELVKRYDITPARIYQIVRRLEAKTTT